MKIKTIDAVNLYDVLQRIGVNKMGIKTAYKLLRNLDKVRFVAEAYGRIEQALVDECRDPDGKTEGTSFTLLPDKVESFHKRRDEAMQEEVEVEFEKVPIEELEDLEISLEDLDKLRLIIDDGR